MAETGYDDTQPEPDDDQLPNCCKTGVYAIAHPTTGHVVYVGQSYEIEQRFQNHFQLWSVYKNVPLFEWGMQLKREGLEPKLVILLECDSKELNAHEVRLIREHRAAGGCEFNKLRGGSGNKRY